MKAKANPKRARQLAVLIGPPNHVEEACAQLEALAGEVEILREMTRCADHRYDESHANGCPECVREMREEVQTKWKPLLEAAKKAVATYDAENAPRAGLEGTYIVATSDYQRLGELEENVEICEKLKAWVDSKP